MSIFSRITGFFNPKPVPTNKPKKVDVFSLQNESSVPYDIHEGAKYIARVNKEWAKTIKSVEDALDRSVASRPEFAKPKDLTNFKDNYAEIKEEIAPVLAALFLEVQKKLDRTKMKDMPGTFFTASVNEVLMYLLWDYEFSQTRDKRPGLVKMVGVDPNSPLGKGIAVQMHVRAIMDSLHNLMDSISNLMAQEEITKS